MFVTITVGIAIVEVGIAVGLLVGAAGCCVAVDVGIGGSVPVGIGLVVGGTAVVLAAVVGVSGRDWLTAVGGLILAGCVAQAVSNRNPKQRIGKLCMIFLHEAASQDNKL